MISASKNRLPDFDDHSQMNYEPLVNQSRQDQQGCGSYDLEITWLLDPFALKSDRSEFDGKSGEKKGVNMFG